MYSIENQFIKVEIASLGAEVQRIFHKTHHIDYLWHGDAEFWGRRSPVLFPVVGRLINHAYVFEEKIYNMPGHGFARDKEFTLVSNEADRIVLVLKSDETTYNIYPFSFELYCEYVIKDETLTVTYTIINLDQEKTMYFSIGAHPGFSTQLKADDKFEDYTLTFKTQSRIYQYALSGVYLDTQSKKEVADVTIPLHYPLFANDALVFETDNQEVSVSLQTTQHEHGVTVTYQHNPFIGIWTPYPKQAPFICIEPWQGVADVKDFTGDLTQKLGIHTLSGQSQSTFAYTITVC